MADTPQAVDSLERIRKALETQALTHPGVAICDKSDLRSLLAREAALREALREIAEPVDCGCFPCTGQCTARGALAIRLQAKQDIARAALASTEPTKEAR